MMNHHNQKGMDSGKPKNWARVGNHDHDLYGKHGIEIIIWSLSEDNTQSWVSVSHGSNKFVIDSNNNDTEVPEDLLEEQALQLNVEDFACRSKAKAKPQKGNLLAIHQGSFRWTEGLGLILNQGKILSPIMRFRRKWSIFFDILGNTTRRWRSGSILENQRTSSESISTISLLVWRSLERMLGSTRRSKKEISVLHWCFRNIYKLFKIIQDAILLILQSPWSIGAWSDQTTSCILTSRKMEETSSHGVLGSQKLLNRTD